MIALLAAPPTPAAGAIAPLDIRLGLWEITLTVKIDNPPPLPPQVLAKLTPEQRARIESKARQRDLERAQTTVKSSCLGDKERHQPSLFAFGEAPGCHQTVLNASRTRQEIQVDCGPGLSKGGGTFRIEAIDPENVKVSSDWFATDGSRTLRSSSSATLRWLGASCELGPPASPQAANVPAPPGTPAMDAGYFYTQGRQQAARNDLQEALRSLNRAIELDPRRATAYNARGYAYLRLQDYAHADADFSEAIRLRPGYPNALQNRAVARRHLGEGERAAADDRSAAALKNHP